MANEKRYHELTLIADVNVEDDMLIPIDRDDFSETQVATRKGIVYAEKTRAEAMELAIQTGAGLQTDGTYDADDTTNYIKTTDFAAAALAESLKNADILLDAAIKTIDDRLNCADYSFTDAEIKALHTTAIPVLSSPGAGKYRHVLAISGWLTFNTTAYSTADPIKFRYIGGTDEIGNIDTTFIQHGNTIYFRALLNNSIELGLNAGIEAFASGAITLGNSAITVHFCYQDVDAVAVAAGSVTCCVDSYTTTFTNASLTSGWIEFAHSLGTKSLIFSIIGLDENGDEIYIQAPAYPGKHSTGFSDKLNYLSFYFDILGAGTYTVTIMAKI